MEALATNEKAGLKISGRRGREEKKEPNNTSFLGSLALELLVEPPFLITLSYINIAASYFLILILIAGYNVNLWYGIIILPLLYIIDVMRKSAKETKRVEVAHRIPFFADALANSLSVGSTLEHSLIQASYYLKGKIKKQFEAMMIKISLGRNLGQLMRELEVQYPNTGLMYLISLLDAYNELGIGISPLLKRISVVLTEKERAEEKVRTILSAGSSYARLTVGIFAAIFLGLGLMMHKQVLMLFSPTLKPFLIFLTAWSFIGIVIITRISSLDFSRATALKPFIANFIKDKNLNEEQLMYLSGIEWTPLRRQLFLYGPFLGGWLFSYIFSGFNSDPLAVAAGFVIGTLIFQQTFKYILKGMVEDQLIKTIEVFPDVLQVFIIGLNSGLNTYLAFQFAQKALKGGGTKLLIAELTRTNFAMECGEDHSRTWQILAENLPFETVVDFCEIMIVAPMAGESIVNSIIQMSNSYQDKKLKLIEKKANTIGQIVIPLIIMVFLPLFLFVMFGPLIVNISKFIIHSQ